jgi:hypothetical protein
MARIRLGREQWRSGQAKWRHTMSASRAHRSSPQNALRLGDLGFLVQNRAEGKGILTRGSLWRVGFLDGSRRRLKVLGLRWWCTTSTELLWLHEAALKLHLNALKLLLGSIDSDDGESSSRGGYLCVLGYQYLWIKIHRRMGTIYRAFCTES